MKIKIDTLKIQNDVADFFSSAFQQESGTMAGKKDSLITHLARSEDVFNTKMLVNRGIKIVHELDRNSRQAVILQHRLLMDLLEENKDTEFGKKHHFSEIRHTKDYMSKVPLTTYGDYESCIQRMMKGEKNLLSTMDPVHYALSSGSVGDPKYIPVSEKELKKYVKYSGTMSFGVADEYYRNTTGKSLPAGHGLNAIEEKIVEAESGVAKNPVFRSMTENLKSFIPLLLASPWELIQPEGEMDMKYLKTRLALEYRDLVFMDSAFITGLVDLMDYIRNNYKMLCKDIFYGRINEDVKIPSSLRNSLEGILKPDKLRARELMWEFNQGFDTPIIPRIWPKMSWIGGVSTGSFFPYARRMRKYSGKSIPFNNMSYAASESFMAVARHMGDESFVLIPDGGFYEFIPVHGKNTATALTIEDLEIGEDYEIVVTNLSGFYRYRLQDVVRVTGYYNETPLLRFLYRKDQCLSIAGENTHEEALRWAMEQFSRELSLHVIDYSVYADTSTSPGRYILLVEPEQIVPKEMIDHCRDVLEEKLMLANASFGDKIRSGELGKIKLIFLQQQTYQLYRDLMMMKGKSANQLKPVRVIDTPMKKQFFFGLKENYIE